MTAKCIIKKCFSVMIFLFVAVAVLLSIFCDIVVNAKTDNEPPICQKEYNKKCYNKKNCKYKISKDGELEVYYYPYHNWLEEMDYNYGIGHFFSSFGGNYPQKRTKYLYNKNCQKIKKYIYKYANWITLESTQKYVYDNAGNLSAEYFCDKNLLNCYLDKYVYNSDNTLKEAYYYCDENFKNWYSYKKFYKGDDKKLLSNHTRCQGSFESCKFREYKTYDSLGNEISYQEITPFYFGNSSKDLYFCDEKKDICISSAKYEYNSDNKMVLAKSLCDKNFNYCKFYRKYEYNKDGRLIGEYWCDENPNKNCKIIEKVLAMNLKEYKYYDCSSMNTKSCTFDIFEFDKKGNRIMWYFRCNGQTSLCQEAYKYIYNNQNKKEKTYICDGYGKNCVESK